MQFIAEVVTNSPECNVAQLVTKKDDSTIVSSHNWTGFLPPHMKKMSGIKQFHHFTMSASSPGDVFVRELSESDEVKITIVNEPWTPETDEMPPPFALRGLTNEKQCYLYKQI